MVASNLHGVAREVRIVNLEGLGDGEDVFDWIKREPFHAVILDAVKQGGKAGPGLNRIGTAYSFAPAE
jgi:hypothetical protein